MTLALVRTALAGQAVAVGALTPLTYYGTTLPPALTTGHLPCRLLLAGDAQGRSNAGAFVALGKLAETTRQISDLLFWQAVAQGIGRSGVEADLTTYCDNYETMLRNFRSAGQSAAHILSWQLDIQTIAYPAQSTFTCWGVVCIVQIQEYASG